MCSSHFLCTCSDLYTSVVTCPAAEDMNDCSEWYARICQCGTSFLEYLPSVLKSGMTDAVPAAPVSLALLMSYKLYHKVLSERPYLCNCPHPPPPNFYI